MIEECIEEAVKAKLLPFCNYFLLYLPIIIFINLSDNLNPLLTNLRIVPTTSIFNPFLSAKSIISIVPIISIFNDCAIFLPLTASIIKVQLSFSSANAIELASPLSSLFSNSCCLYLFLTSAINIHFGRGLPNSLYTSLVIIIF
jgi:hypothetical protein